MSKQDLSFPYFHQCLNPNNDRLYIPLGNFKKTDNTPEDIKKCFKKAKNKWDIEHNRLTGDEIVAYFSDQAVKQQPFALGWYVPKGCVVIDIDNYSTSELLANMLDKLHIKHTRLKTSKGKHFIFRANPDVHPAQRAICVPTPIGMVIDYLTADTSYIFLPFKVQAPYMEQYNYVFEGRFAEIITPLDEMDYLPDWLIPNSELGKPKGATQLDKQDSILPMPLLAGNKTDNLQRWLHNLGYRGYNVTVCTSLIKLINQFICTPPIPAHTLDSEVLNQRNLGNVARSITNELKSVEAATGKILDNAGKKKKSVDTRLYEQSSEEMREAVFNAEGAFCKVRMAIYLSRKYHIKNLDGELLIYRDGIYVRDNMEVQKIILSLLPQLLSKQVFEIMYHLRCSTYDANNQFEVDKHMIAVENGVVDLKTGQLLEFSPNHHVFNKLDFPYMDFSDYRSMPLEQRPIGMITVDKFLNDITCGDVELQHLLVEMCAYTLWQDLSLKKAFILHGSGDNGKSILLSMLQNILGPSSYTTLEFNDFNNENFKVANIRNKLACITGDISSQRIKETNLFKAIVSGDPITAGRKFEQASTFTPYSTIIMSANTLPYSSDVSDGFFERMVIIPFDRDFVREGIADRGIKEKVNTFEALTYLTFLMIEASSKLFERKVKASGTNKQVFTIGTRAKRAISNYVAQHSPILQWLYDAGIDKNEDYFVGKNLSDVYTEFFNYCQEIDLPTISKIAVGKMILDAFPKLSKKRNAHGVILVKK